MTISGSTEGTRYNMGTTWHVQLFDEFDWRYANKSKAGMIGDFRKLCPWAKVVSEWYGWIIFDVDKWYPNAHTQEILGLCDSAFVIRELSGNVERLKE
jgi:hypothetical protein